MSANSGFGSADYRPPPADTRYQDRTESSESIGSILSGLLGDLQGMVRGEIALARAEVKEDVSSVGKAVTSLAAVPSNWKAVVYSATRRRPVG